MAGLSVRVARATKGGADGRGQADRDQAAAGARGAALARAGDRRMARRRPAADAVRARGRRTAARRVTADASVYGDAWDSLGEHPWEGGAHSRRLARGAQLGASVYELAPGTTGGLYHFHHGAEELLVVLSGRATL